MPTLQRSTMVGVENIRHEYKDKNWGNASKI